VRILAILTACAALAACGDEERPAAAAITIENRLGSVEIRERPELLDVDAGMPLERIAALRPDVILATNAFGRALGREGRARELVRDVEAQIAEARETHTDFDDRTISFFNFVDGNPYVINSEDGRAEIGPERLDTIDADVIMGTSPTPDALEKFARGTLFQRLDGAWISLALAPATSIAFPSLLSIPYALDELVPKLAEAVR
jgi:iron complex transport system substrate-binding protein